MLIRQAKLLDGGLCDLRLANGRIAERAAALAPKAGETVIEAAGNLLLPGLQDHHLHLFATAAARASIDCGPASINSVEELRQLIQRAPGAGWLRGTGFHDSICPDLDRYTLDRICPHRPLRIQHRSGILWVLNSPALDALAITADQLLPAGAERDGGGRLTGRFFNLDAWLGERIPRRWPCLRALSYELASYGITGVTDTGVNNDRHVWAALEEASQRGELLQRALVMGSEDLNGVRVKRGNRLDLGPLKLYLREAELPALEGLVQRIAAAHQRERAVAFHCVTRTELHFALLALAEAGVLQGDRIEHASIADNTAAQRMAELGVVAVTQPHFIAERGDQYLQDVEDRDQPLLYRAAGLLERRVSLAAGSDAPYGATDPWAAVRAAVERRTRSGVTMGVDERLTPEQALGLFGGSLRRPGGGLRTLAIGTPADLCLLDLPRVCLREALHSRHVAMTICGGDIIYNATASDPSAALAKVS